ncbi:MAG: ATP-dependent helicase [Pseudomonadota bacterium]
MKNSDRISYNEALNPSQLKAVNFDEGPLLVIAGAGSGKTRTLTYRVARLVEKGVAPSSILLLTFTRKASLEMLKRAALLLDNRCEKVAGGTFHSFANATLRKYASKLGFRRDFSILDRVDSEALISMLRKEIISVSGHRSFPRKHSLAAIFSRAANKVLTVAEVILNDYPHFASNLDAIITLYNTYNRHKVENFLCDYDDLLVYLKTLLEDHQDIRDRISSLYHYIMVDEYQDTNLTQAEIIRLLAGRRQNVMVVGDDSQSIYAFRGANFKNIMKFPEIFPGTRIIRLEENYRSVQPILSLANVIIERAKEKYSKILFTRRPGGPLPVLVRADTENSQSRFVVAKIRELNQSGIPLKQIAVLFRANFHSFDLEIELNRAAIPFVKVGGFKFIESAHIKDFLAHLRVLSNPYDSVCWQRILLLLDRIGFKNAQKIYEAILAEKSGYAGVFSVKTKKVRSSGFKGLADLFALIDSTPMSVTQAGEAVFNYYVPILKDKYDDHPKRTKDLEQLLNIMGRYRTISAFLTDMALEPPNTSFGASFATDDPVEDRLILSTVHSAKGLEWHTVFIIWALEGRFPSIHALHNEEDLEEELRLMYVAATRAKENLFFTYPRQIYDRTSGMVLNRPSRFIADIPGNILKKYTTEG